MRGLRVDKDANEIAIISRFDLLFQSLRDYFGDISGFHILDRMIALNEMVETQSSSKSEQFRSPAQQSAPGPPLLDNLHLTAVFSSATARLRMRSRSAKLGAQKVNGYSQI
jgi:hypothetical protein